MFLRPLCSCAKRAGGTPYDLFNREAFIRDEQANEINMFLFVSLMWRLGDSRRVRNAPTERGINFHTSPAHF